MGFALVKLRSNGGDMMDERINQTEVRPELDGVRVDVFLARRFTYLSRAGWQQEIADGRIWVNQAPACSASLRLRSGDIVRYRGGRIEEPPVDAAFGVLYEDEHLLGVDKTGNLPVHPSGRYFRNTLLRILEERLRQKLYPVHRLDRETSGLILLAKDSRTASSIQRNFHRVRKSYVAIVRGTVREREFNVDEPIGFDPSSLIKKKRAVLPGGQEARTRFRRILRFGDYSLLRAMPETGRLHQIRVHLHHAGYPIVGDKLYGRDAGLFARFIQTGLTPQLLQELELERCALHSRSLWFFHPVKKRHLFLKAPLPADMRSFIEERRAHG